MIDLKEKFANLVEELKDEKKELEIRLQVAKLELEEEFEEVKDKYADKDEWRVRMHLAKLEMEEEWDKIEDKLSYLREKAGPLIDASEDKLHEGMELAKKLGGEIRQGIAKIREKI